MRSRANLSKFTDRRQRLFTRGIAALVVALGLALVPTPYYLIAPGKAVDLATRVSVEGRPPPLRRFYLTDVTVARASVLLLAARLWPGVRIVRRDALVPPGESARGYDRAMVDAMGESQIAAAIVAERAAGYRVPEPARQVVAVDFLPASRADGILAVGDGLTRVNGAAIRNLGDIAGALRGVAPGTSVAVSFVRGGRAMATRIVTIPGPHGARLGVLVARRTSRAALPVPVRYAIGDIAGSSGGLMFALEIYESLRPGRARDPVAGTGTLTTDGRIGPIEGVRQKLIAAERAGAQTFLVPRQNYPELAHDDHPKIRIIPVATFAEALAVTQ
jgi:PDZ domain-containing protein